MLIQQEVQLATEFSAFVMYISGVRLDHWNLTVPKWLTDAVPLLGADVMTYRVAIIGITIVLALVAWMRMYRSGLRVLAEGDVATTEEDPRTRSACLGSGGSD